jgi:alpha-beta hydrolase superfamily lysophospholipase
MRSSEFTHQASDGKTLFVRRFLPDDSASVKAIVHLAHGMAEHSARYARVAEALTTAGYAVYANDHRGHGKTASPDELGFFAEKDGFARVVGDLVELVAREKKEHPDLPLVLVGHSMGSYMVQEFIIDHGREIAGAVLSGSAGKPNLLASAGRLLARAVRLRAGARGKSKLLGDLSFGAFNKQFAPTRTAFDWLSRDVAEVDKYVTDPLCGFDVTTSLWVDVLDALASIARPERQARIPKDLPIYVFSGSEDPVSGNTKSLEQLLAAYRLAGVRDVAHRFYPGARHETLNETNRDEVTRDLITWLDVHTQSRITTH